SGVVKTDGRSRAMPRWTVPGVPPTSVPSTKTRKRTPLRNRVDRLTNSLRPVTTLVVVLREAEVDALPEMVGRPTTWLDATAVPRATAVKSTASRVEVVVRLCSVVEDVLANRTS